MDTLSDHRMRPLGLAVVAVLLAAGIAAAETGTVGKFDPTTGAGDVKLSSGVRRFSCVVSKPAVSLRVNQKVEVDVKSETLQLPGGHEKCRLVAQGQQPPQQAPAPLCAEPATSTPRCQTPVMDPTRPPGTMQPGVEVGNACFLAPVGNPGYPGSCAALKTACPSGFEFVGCCMGAFGNPTSGPVYASVTCKRVQ
jgi:hypothetical protein